VTGLLVVVGLVAVVMAVFVRQFRRRVQANLQRAGHELPAELKAALRAGVKKPAVAPAAAATATAAARAMPPAVRPLPAGGLHFMLIYDVTPDFIQKRAACRDEHLALAWKAAAAGELLLAGALEEPAEQAFLLFRGSREAAQRFAQADPYVRQGLVKQWRVKQWHTVAGEAAAMPLRPSAKVQ